LKSRWIRSDADEMNFDVFDHTPLREEKLVPLEVDKGSMIILHGWLPHKSFANRSVHSRHAYTLHVISAHSHYPKNNWLQRPSEMPLRGFD
jgi:phytanoyl-CoA hydroxylase